MMSNGRHSYVAFYPSDWLAGTARMRSRILRSVYFDICVFIWDTAKPCPETELAAMLDDLPNWPDLVEQLISLGKLVRNNDRSVVNAKAISEALKSFDSWKAMSEGGRAKRKGPYKPPSEGGYNGASQGALEGLVEPPSEGGYQGSAKGVPTEPEPEPEPEVSGTAQKRGKRLAADFVMPLDWIRWAMSERKWIASDARTEAAAFTDHWHAKTGKDATKLDWLATWRNWVRNSRRKPSANGSANDPEMPLYA